MKRFLLIAILGCLLSGNMMSAEESSKQTKVIALVKKAILYIRENNKPVAFAEFNQMFSRFTDHDIYIFVLDKNGKTLANSNSREYIGKDVSNLQDVDGRYFVREILALAEIDGAGWVTYKWINPITKGVQTKRTYFEKTDDMIIASGYYVN